MSPYSAYFTAYLMLCCALQIIKGKSTLILSNNGPAVLDSSITFTSILESLGDLCYVFNDGVQNYSSSATGQNLTETIIFSSEIYTQGIYNMTIYARNCVNNQTVASNHTKFELKDYLIGRLIVDQDVNNLFDVDEVAVGENMSISVNLYDPNDFLAAAVMSYMWSIDYEHENFIFNNLTHVYKYPALSKIKAVVSAQLPDYTFKYGYFDKRLVVKDPINNINVSGNTYIHHGDMLSLDISCNGSLPFKYCAQLLELHEVVSNFTCHQIITSTTCNFQFKHYFQSYGSFHIGIYITNDVTTAKRILDIVVYNVAKIPQLSTVIIPIVCSLLTLCIIAGGISFYIQQRNHLTIEVANFDFQEDSVDSYVSKTFFEKVFFLCSCKLCNYGEEEDYDELFEEEDEPLLHTHNSNKVYC